MTIDRKAWTFRRNAPLSDFLTIEELLANIIQTVRSELCLSDVKCVSHVCVSGQSFAFQM